MANFVSSKGERRNQCPPPQNPGVSSVRRQQQPVQENNTKCMSYSSGETFVLKFGGSSGTVV